MSHVADILTEKIMETQAPIVVGLDPVLDRIPLVFRESAPDDLSGAGQIILTFSKAVIDAVKDLVPAVKPQVAFYEKYGETGMRAFRDTCLYAHQCGLSVIADCKRNDIGNTARAYADSYLGEVTLPSGTKATPYAIDFLTVSPFLGPESLDPFVDVAKAHHKGIFILAKTSNKGSAAFQDVRCTDGATISEKIAALINRYAQTYSGAHGYSPIGAVVGATYPHEAAHLRSLMPQSIVLVPGYGAQGASAADIVPNFHSNGLGALVNASRSIDYAYEQTYGDDCSKDAFHHATAQAVALMQKEIYAALKTHCPHMHY